MKILLFKNIYLFFIVQKRKNIYVYYKREEIRQRREEKKMRGDG